MTARLPTVVLLAILAAPAARADPASPVLARVRAWIAAHEVEVLREFRELLSIPNLASDEPNIRRNAEAIVAMFARRSITTRLLESPGAPPVVFASLPATGSRHTVIFYAHYDGQPLDPTRWTGKPWDHGFSRMSPEDRSAYADARIASVGGRSCAMDRSRAAAGRCPGRVLPVPSTRRSSCMRVRRATTRLRSSGCLRRSTRCGPPA